MEGLTVDGQRHQLRSHKGDLRLPLPAKAFHEHDRVRIVKATRLKGKFAVVVDPEWLGLVKVEMEENDPKGRIKTFNVSDLELVQIAEGGSPSRRQDEAAAVAEELKVTSPKVEVYHMDHDDESMDDDHVHPKNDGLPKLSLPLPSAPQEVLKPASGLIMGGLQLGTPKPEDILKPAAPNIGMMGMGGGMMGMGVMGGGLQLRSMFS